ncbi:MAG: SRPBCC domain-containing protein [Myxococcales bacterium]|nr:SRPBCC domain-containing protein [Myxococcales bacterium]
MATVRQEVTLPAPPSRVYDALLKSDQHAAFTGEAATIDARPGGAWKAYDGKIAGYTLDLEPAARIVQAWRAGNWAPGYYSVVRFELAAADGGTRLTLVHDALPADQAGHIDGGWHAMYWEKLKTYLG